jgi:hypothetical protein
MFRLWLNRERKLGIPASFESYNLVTIGGGRGDMAMIMLGLSKYLLAKGDTNLASEFWPLLLKVAENTKTATLTNGVVGSGSDELEGRYPNGGKANLSTSSLSYAGYRAAARLARALGKVEEAQDYGTRADDLGKAIESHFGAEVEGFFTYRYYEGCVCLRGWISLPVFAGIMNRKQGTVDALFSTNLWTENQFSTGIKAASTDKSSSGWPRETYYALIAAFKAGYTSQALEKTITAVRHGMLSNHGPYLSEDGGNLLSPNVLYLRVITDGLFGIEPQSFTSFSCSPRLPTAWPSMKFSNIWLMGKPIDIEVKREAQSIRCIVLSGSVRLLDSVAADGSTFAVDMKAITSVRSNQ